eukprot:CAMPEP_0201918826 /NCGR_PEP_ID=MMETSP0903-20130614/7877_1 /ASSEMBLY_ACC=CAM_ASM_000552 /TAXON_ID=420261 /ORGANISM="Thalassiosira antarctica, Strain CCMP982" /LENGTH=78 /DNA_ID=CAMNT_0048455213 /DNA_START=872 /DNA_END=1108 /DNA_ORIENTATION=-
MEDKPQLPSHCGAIRQSHGSQHWKGSRWPTEDGAMASVQAGAMEDQAKPEATFAIRLWIHRIHRSHGDQQWSKKSSHG